MRLLVLFTMLLLTSCSTRKNVEQVTHTQEKYQEQIQAIFVDKSALYAHISCDSIIERINIEGTKTKTYYNPRADIQENDTSTAIIETEQQTDNLTEIEAQPAAKHINVKTLFYVIIIIIALVIYLELRAKRHDNKH